MRKNNKGFMLVEALVAGTIVLTSMIALYTGFNRLYKLYNERMNYYNIDGTYATKMMINHLMDNEFNNFINSKFSTSNYYQIINDSSCDDTTGGEFCSSIKELYNVNEMIITLYDKSTLENDILSISGLNQSFIDYVKFVNNYYDVANNSAKYKYLVLTEIKDGNNYYYANLGIG